MLVLEAVHHLNFWKDLSYPGWLVSIRSNRLRLQNADLSIQIQGMARSNWTVSALAAIAALAVCYADLSALPAQAQSDRSNLSSGEQTPGSGDPDYLLQAGTTALRANHLDEAIAKFQAACQISPNLADAHHQWGIALVKAGRPTEAINQFKTAIALNPQQAASWLSLGGAYQSAGNLPEAINAYSDYLTHFPQDRDGSKVRQLIVLLKKEPGSNSVALGASQPNPSNQVLPAPDSLGKSKDRSAASTSTYDTGGGADDYYKEMTRTGVLRWPIRQMPLKVWIEDGNNVRGYRPVFAGILKQAFSDWADASNGKIKVVFVPDILKANIICRWSDQPEKFKNSAEAGESRLYSDRYGIAKGELSILTVATSPILTVTDNRLRAIVLHEVGHMLGMTGHTTDPRDTMFNSASISDSWRDLSLRDKATIARLYRED
jgi:tetratricopeptide (TPR) repeat protein